MAEESHSEHEDDISNATWAWIGVGIVVALALIFAFAFNHFDSAKTYEQKRAPMSLTHFAEVK